MLGEGGFGRVLRGVHIETGQVAAVKFIPKKSLRDVADADRVFIEIQALRELSHQHVIRMHSVIDHPNYICLVMQHASKGELRNYVLDKGRLEENESLSFFEQVVKGVHYCHSRSIVHRDLKLENILLDESLRCKIVDFGLSDFVVGSKPTMTAGGTEAYLAPEVWNRTSHMYSPYKLDVWALGIILFAMLHGKIPFNKPDAETIEKIKRGELPFDADVSPEIRRGILQMLHPDPELRWTLNRVIDFTKAQRASEFDRLAPAAAALSPVPLDAVSDEATGPPTAQTSAPQTGDQPHGAASSSSTGQTAAGAASPLTTTRTPRRKPPVPTARRSPSRNTHPRKPSVATALGAVLPKPEADGAQPRTASPAAPPTPAQESPTARRRGNQKLNDKTNASNANKANFKHNQLYPVTFQENYRPNPTR
eukprot:GHVT01067606.1.p1 GENE.GHVT01067606.1~~GHVT01067606.1.p1  ORF type:complete len:423 (+),score=90.87 GHVT01067606.1:2151-3419(+)